MSILLPLFGLFIGLSVLAGVIAWFWPEQAVATDNDVRPQSMHMTRGRVVVSVPIALIVLTDQRHNMPPANTARHSQKNRDDARAANQRIVELQG